MVRQAMTRRRLLLTAGVAGVGGLAGCIDDGGPGDSDDGGDDETTDTEPTTGGTADEPTAETEQTPTDDGGGEQITVSGRLVGPGGSPVTVGQAISLGNPEGLVAVAPDGDGNFSLDLTSGNTYALQYTQGADQYPTDGLPDIYTIDELAPTGNTDLGEISLPRAYEVDVTVETGDGTDVTDDASVTVSHVNDGSQTGFELTNNPIELAGEIRFRASYDGAETRESVTITGAQSVTVTVG